MECSSPKFGSRVSTFLGAFGCIERNSIKDVEVVNDNKEVSVPKFLGSSHVATFMGSIGCMEKNVICDMKEPVYEDLGSKVEKTSSERYASFGRKSVEIAAVSGKEESNDKGLVSVEKVELSEVEISSGDKTLGTILSELDN